MPKVVRALGPLALAAWDLAPPKVPARPTAAELITAALIASAARLVDHIAIVVLDEDLEGVHQARVGIRRLRSDLRTARSLLDPEVVGPLRGELRWLMRQFGEVRDLDVLLGGLRTNLESLDPVDVESAGAVLSEASNDRAEAYERLRAALRTPRCAALLEETARVAAEPPFTRRAARRAASEVVPELIKEPLRDLRREAKNQGHARDDDGLHRLRIAVKRVRYAAELAAPVVGKDAHRAARGLARVQDVLGDHHDACTAVVRLRGLGARTGAPGAWAAGLLGGIALAHAADRRERFSLAWEKAASPKRWRWAK
jgi:CHAD domain-containing protein